jgi:hypothetical protein
MIPSNMWRQNEPRLNLPIFGDALNEVDFSVQDDRKLSMRRLIAPAYHFVRGGSSWRAALSNYRNMLAPSPFRFKACFVDRQGEIKCHEEFLDTYQAGDFFYLNVNEWLRRHDIKMQDGSLILISSHGRADRWQSSPGNVTLRVSEGGHVAGYRTGFFARALNSGHKHVGFTGLNPRIEVNAQWVSGLLLVNHSSEPAYDKTVRPTVRLHRNPESFLETTFGDIAPHAASERSILELFPNAEEFLASAGGIGYSVSTLSGASLASVHVLRHRSGQLASLEHSRPAHTNIINYL